MELIYLPPVPESPRFLEAEVEGPPAPGLVSGEDDSPSVGCVKSRKLVAYQRKQSGRQVKMQTRSSRYGRAEDTMHWCKTMSSDEIKQVGNVKRKLQ